MHLKAVFAQRKQEYPGQFAPELLTAWDEYSIDENPEGYDDDKERVIEDMGHDLDRWIEVTLEVDEDRLKQLLSSNITLQTKIKE